MPQKTFKFEAVAAGGNRVSGVLEAESSQDAVDKLKEQGLMPVKVTPESDRSEESSTVSPRTQRAVEVTSFYSYGWKIRWRKLLVFYIPFLVTEGICTYLFFTRKPVWIVFPLMGAGLFVFGFIGHREEAKMLGLFNCPRCQSAIEDWDTTPKGRIIFTCPQCGGKWDIGYKLRSGGHG